MQKPQFTGIFIYNGVRGGCNLIPNSKTERYALAQRRLTRAETASQKQNAARGSETPDFLADFDCLIARMAHYRFQRQAKAPPLRSGISRHPRFVRVAGFSKPGFTVAIFWHSENTQANVKKTI
jgi:hypothetical protein